MNLGFVLILVVGIMCIVYCVGFRVFFGAFGGIFGRSLNLSFIYNTYNLSFNFLLVMILCLYFDGYHLFNFDADSQI